MNETSGQRPKRKPQDSHKIKKRTKLSPVQYYDDDDSKQSEKCNHEMASLKKLEDGKYFTPECYYASVCHKCGGHVRDRIPA